MDSAKADIASKMQASASRMQQSESPRGDEKRPKGATTGPVPVLSLKAFSFGFSVMPKSARSKTESDKTFDETSEKSSAKDEASTTKPQYQTVADTGGTGGSSAVSTSRAVIPGVAAPGNAGKKLGEALILTLSTRIWNDRLGDTKEAQAWNEATQASEIHEVLDMYGFTAYDKKVWENGVERKHKLRMLLESMTADQINAIRDEYGRTALEIAAHNDDLAAIRLLLECGADPRNDPPECYRAIHLAAKSGDLDLVRLLIVKGEKLDEVTGNGDTPLIMAARAGRQDVVEFLIGAGARLDMLNSCGRNAFIAAIGSGDIGIANLLLKANENASAPFDLNQQDGYGYTALGLAYAKYGHCRKYLIDLRNPSHKKVEIQYQKLILLLQQKGAGTDFHLHRDSFVYYPGLSKECIARSVRAGLGQEGDPEAKVHFSEVLPNFYHHTDKSYKTLLSGKEAKTRYEQLLLQKAEQKQKDSRNY